MMKALPQFFLSCTRLVIAIVMVCGMFLIQTWQHSSADELSDINKQIQQKEKEKNETLQKISTIETKIQALLSKQGDINQKSETLADLKLQKNDLDSQINTLQSQISEQEKALENYITQVKASESDIQQETNYLYKLTFLSSDNVFEDTQTLSNFFSESVKTNASIELFKRRVQEYNDRIAEAEAIRANLQTDREKTAASKSSIEASISQLSSEVNAYNKSVADANNSKTQLNAKLDELGSQLKFMSAKQAALLQAELAKMQQQAQVKQTPITSGQYYFSGRGRDLIDGHGLGMSQWGAYGMAQNGWTYDAILKFYYTGVTISDYQEPATIVVDGKTSGPIPYDDYLAGIGEMPNSWPAEAIKAQIVAARTYAMKSAYRGSDGNMHICGTDACQVYVGGTGKKQFVTETKGKVILYGGQPITAFYSASHRGYSSTLNSVWGGSDQPYIQPVNDDAWAFKDYRASDPYNAGQMIKPYNWNWRTNGYSIDQLSDIFSRNASLKVGKLKRIDIQKDPPGKRVAKITLVGESGTKTMTGSSFRSLFNTATPYADYIYSTEFNFEQSK